MIPVVSAKQMAEMESNAYQEGYKEETFMAKAGLEIAKGVKKYIEEHQLEKTILLLGGKGNNTGDGYVALCHLKEWGLDTLSYQVAPPSSPLCKDHYTQYTALGGTVTDKFPTNFSGLILDGLFGTGFHGVAKAPFGKMIEEANQSGLPILAIDIPSGLNGNTGSTEGPVIKASQTLYLGLPKLGFFLDQGWNLIGELRGADFGLPEKFIREIEWELLEKKELILPKVVRNRHKYESGYVVGIAGSPGMPGAAQLASLAALRAGAGIVRLLHPEGMEGELSASPYELVRVPYKTIEEKLDLIKKGQSLFIGPGLGRTKEAKTLLETLFKTLDRPAVVDADALFYLGDTQKSPPKGAILTPHLGEMGKLLALPERPSATATFLEECQEYVEKHEIILLLKGGPTFILAPGKKKTISPFGTAGMATAGSGDVLTGIIAALLAQSLDPFSAATLGAAIHGLCGEVAAKEKTNYSLIASDLIDALPSVFEELI